MAKHKKAKKDKVKPNEQPVSGQGSEAQKPRLKTKDYEKELYKLLDAHPGKARIHTDRWNAYSRITSVVGHDPKQVVRLFIDSSAETSIIPWDGKPAYYPGAEAWFRAFPFRLKREPEAGPRGASPSTTSSSVTPTIRTT